MTLYKQLALIIVLVFTLGFAGTVVISTNNLRHFLAEQLASHAQDTATSLGLSLSPAMQDRDYPVMETMVDAIYDRGYYQSIVVESTGGDRLIERSSQVVAGTVPAWFTRSVKLDTPRAAALVMSGWKPAATVSVTSHPGYAYHELWDNTIDTLLLFSISGCIVLLLSLAGVHFLLKPLRRVESQADAICNRRYVVQDKLPYTRELRTVVTAMNRLSGKINDIFSEQSAQTEHLRELAYKDPVTGLGNREYFNRQLRSLLESPEEAANGAILLVEIRNLGEVNGSIGFQAGDRLLQRAGELMLAQLDNIPRHHCARISGAGFGIIATGLDMNEVDELAAVLCRELERLHTERLTGHSDVASIGIALWHPGDTVSDVLSAADLALRSAQAAGENNWFRHEPSVREQQTPRGAGEWQVYLEHVLNNRLCTLFSQAVIAPGGEAAGILHRELLLRIPDAGGELLPAGVFMPMAERMDMAAGFDRLTITRALEVAASGDDHLAINLTASALRDAEFRNWLVGLLKADTAVARRLLFETPEYQVAGNPDAVSDFIQQIRATGSRFGIDHFGRSFHSFGYLNSIGVDYLKIDGSYIRDIDRDADNRFFLQSMIATAHGIDIRVIAETVETQAEFDILCEMGADGIQGHLTGKPELLR